MKHWFTASLLTLLSVLSLRPALCADTTKSPDADQPKVEAAGQPPSAAPAPTVSPSDRPPPPGLAFAVKLLGQKKYGEAQKALEKLVSDGVADVETHASLAYCLYQQRRYSKAQKEYEWVAKYATKKLSLQRQADNTARTLASLRAGRCPNSCLKADDPRWQREKNGTLWIRFYNSPRDYMSWSTHHIGQIIAREGGQWVNKGGCPTCNSTTRVPVLKDGDPPPR